MQTQEFQESLAGSWAWILKESKNWKLYDWISYCHNVAPVTEERFDLHIKANDPQTIRDSDGDQIAFFATMPNGDIHVSSLEVGSEVPLLTKAMILNYHIGFGDTSWFDIEIIVQCLWDEHQEFDCFADMGCECLELKNSYCAHSDGIGMCNKCECYCRYCFEEQLAYPEDFSAWFFVEGQDSIFGMREYHVDDLLESLSEYLDTLDYDLIL